MAEECVSETSSVTKRSIYNQKVGIVAEKVAGAKESGVKIEKERVRVWEKVNRKEGF